MSLQYKQFIKENVALKGAFNLCLYNQNDEKIARIKNLNFIKDNGKKLFSFGIISDTHCNETTIEDPTLLNYMPKLLEFFREQKCSWIGITGDIVEDGTMGDRSFTIGKMLKKKDEELYNKITQTEERYKELLKDYKNEMDLENKIIENYKEDRQNAIDDWDTYKSIIDEHYKQNGCKIIAIAGNHEQYRYDNHGCLHLLDSDQSVPIRNFNLEFTGIDKPTYFLFNVKNNNLDIITEKELLNNKQLLNKYENVIMCLGCRRYYSDSPSDVQVFTKEELFKIQSDFELLRNKRMFVLTHIPVQNKFLNFNFSEVQYNKWVPPSLYEHYSNSIVFHGHTHSPFNKQKTNKNANYNKEFNFKSVHVPHARNLGEGYLVEVYEKGIFLRGVKPMIKNEVEFIDFHPLANYWIDFEIKEIIPNSFNFNPISKTTI